MSKPKIYLDTSVISCLRQTNKPNDRMDCERLFAKIKNDEYSAYISEVTREELENAKDPLKATLLNDLESIPYTLIEVNDEISDLAEEFIRVGVFNPKCYDDSVHIAAAVIAKCDVVVSLNFRHIVNPETARGVRSVCFNCGQKIIDIYSPKSLLKDDDDYATPNP